MRTLDKIFIKTKLATGKMVDSLSQKKRGDSQIVVALVLMAVGLGLGILFKDKVVGIMNDLFTNIGNQIKTLSGSIAE